MPKCSSGKLLTNTTFFSDNLGTYIANGEIETNKLTTNGDIILTGSIINGSNSITFTPITNYTNFLENVHIYKNLYLDYQGVTYNVGQELASGGGGGGGGGGNQYPSITYDPSLNTTTFTGNLIFPTTSISSASINNTSFVSKIGAESIDGIKTFNSPPVMSGASITNGSIPSLKITGTACNLVSIQTVSGFKTFSVLQTFTSNLRLDGSLLVGISGATVILNSTLEKINFLSNITSDINTSLTTQASNITTNTNNITTNTNNITTNTNNITTNTNNISTNTTDIDALEVKTTNQSFSGTTTTWTGSVVFPENSIASTSINNTSFVSKIGAESIDGIKTFNSPPVMSGASITNGSIPSLKITGTACNLVSIQTVSGFKTFSVLQTFTSNLRLDGSLLVGISGATVILNSTLEKINFLSNITSDINTSLTTQASNITTAQNTANSAQATANTAKTNADNAQDTADSAQATASTALGLAGTANGIALTAGALATTANVSANTANSTNVAQQTAIDDLEIDVLALQTKTTNMTYNSATDRTTISQTLYSPLLEIGNLHSGFTQTTADQITIAGLLRCNGRVEINNTLELVNNNNIIVEGIINQDNANPPNAGVNQFQAPTNFNGNCIFTNTTTTINATTTQIGTNALSTLNCNATAEFGGDITMSSAKNLRLKNIVPILLDDIYFGGEAGVHINDDVVFNMKIEANRPVQISNTCQIGTTVNRNTLTSYTTTTILDANTGITLTTPTIGITSPLITIGQADATSITLNSSGVYIGRLLGTNYLYGTTYAGNIYATNLYSATGVLGMAGQVFQQF